MFRFCKAVSKPLNLNDTVICSDCDKSGVEERDTQRTNGKHYRNVDRPEVSLTVTLCSPVRLGHSQSSWLSDRVRMQGVSPISTV